MNAGRLALIALVGFIISTFMVWSNPDGVTRGPFVGDLARAEMLILPSLGYLAAILGVAFGFKRMGRGLGIAVFVFALLNLIGLLFLLLEVGGGIREGLVLILLSSLAIAASGLMGIMKPAPKNSIQT